MAMMASCVAARLENGDPIYYCKGRRGDVKRRECCCPAGDLALDCDCRMVQQIAVEPKHPVACFAGEKELQVTSDE
jgi:hypothetical protein